MKKIFLIVFSAFLMTAQAQVELKMKKKEDASQATESKSFDEKSKAIDYANLTSEKKKEVRKEDRITGGSPIEGAKATQKLFFHKVVRKWGQFTGIGHPLTSEQARHLNCYYALWFNSSGLCVKMEALDGYGRPTTGHNICPYLIENSRGDYRVNSQTAKLVNDVCMWHFSYNDKKRLEREEGYDSNGSLVYVLHMSHHDGKAYGIYTDQYGESLKLRADTLQSPPTRFCITYDISGFDTLLETFDDNGYPCRNLDGAFSCQRIYDSMGRIILEASCDFKGDHMIDDWGNCGFSITFSGDGKQNVCTYRDAQWNAIPLPSMIASEQNGVTIVKEENDVYGRLIKKSFYDANYRKTNNRLGFHQVEYTYNDHGQTTWITYYDMHGNLFCKDSSAVARKHFGYDTQGRTLVEENTNAYNELVNGSNNYARKMYSYQNNVKTREQRWRQLNGEVVKTYDDTLRIMPQGRRFGVRSFPYDPDVVIHYERDEQGRSLFWQYCDTLGTPIIYGNYTYSTNITTYEDLPNRKFRKTDAYRTPDGKLVVNPELNNPYAYSVVITDSIAQTLHIKYFDEDSVVIRNIIHHYSRPDFEKVDFFISLNPYDEPSRWGNESENFIKQRVIRNYKGDAIGWIAYNEYDEPAYMESSDGASHIILKHKDSTQQLDIDGNPTPSNFVWAESYAMSIICLDERGRQSGLQDGDYVLSMGKWDWRKEAPNDALDELWRESMRNVHRQKSIRVIRFHAEDGQIVPQLLSIQLPEGTMADLGLYFQRIMLTPKEKKRFIAAADNLLPISKEEENEAHDSKVSLRMRVPKGYGKACPMYAHGIPQTLRSAYIPLLYYAVEQDSKGRIVANKRWAYGEDINVFYTIFDDSPNCWLFATSDFQTCNKKPIKEKISGMTLYSHVTNTEHERLKAMADSLQTFYDAVLHLEEQVLLNKTKYATATWLQPDRQQGNLTPRQLTNEFTKGKGVFSVKDSSIIKRIGILPETYKDAQYYSYNDDDNGPSEELKRLMLQVDLTQFQLIAQSHPKNNIYKQAWIRKKKKQIMEFFFVSQIDQSYDVYYLPSPLSESELSEIIKHLSPPKEE